GWGHMGFHWITPFHNIAGMLTESASARLASPLTQTKEQLTGSTRNLLTYKEQTNFPSPWPGGVWHLRDIVERQKVAAWAALDLAARNKEMVLKNMYLKGLHQTKRGEEGSPKAYIVSVAADQQHDPLTAKKMLQNLLNQGVEVLQSKDAFTQDGKSYAAGTYVVSMAQPKMGVVRWMLGKTFYPDNEYTRDNDGNPIRPYDMTTDVMAEFMGVTATPTDVKITAAVSRISTAEPTAGKVASGSTLSFSGHLNDSWRAANLLIAKGATVRRVDKTGSGLSVGDYVVTGASAANVNSAAKVTGVDFSAVAGDVSAISHAIKPLRVAMYQRYNGGNADEGWTRLMFEQFDQPYTTIFDKDIKPGSLNAKYDVIILPSDNAGTLVGRGGGAGAGGPGGAGRGAGAAGDSAAAGRGAGRGAAAGAGRAIPFTPTTADPNPHGGGGNAAMGGAGGGGGRGAGGGGGGRGGPPGEGGGAAAASPALPPGPSADYRSGMGDDGVKAIQDFVNGGGTLVTFGESGNFAIEKFQLPLRDVAAGLPFKQFWCPGCTFHVNVDTNNPLGYGMPAEAIATWLSGSQAYEILPAGTSTVQTIVKIADKNVLESGWLLGESVVAGKPTMVSVPVGQGKVVLIGFRVQHRDQTHGTYKLLFNALQK
ncbi:MAG: hypothetical protein ABI625_14270, partial [bacterium]